MQCNFDVNPDDDPATWILWLQEDNSVTDCDGRVYNWSNTVDPISGAVTRGEPPSLSPSSGLVYITDTCTELTTQSGCLSGGTRTTITTWSRPWTARDVEGIVSAQLDTLGFKFLGKGIGDDRNGAAYATYNPYYGTGGFLTLSKQKLITDKMGLSCMKKVETLYVSGTLQASATYHPINCTPTCSLGPPAPRFLPRYTYWTIVRNRLGEPTDCPP